MHFLSKLVGAGALALMCTPVLSGPLPSIKPWGLNLEYIDTGVKPGDDFFAYANNGWLKGAKIPGNRNYAGVNLEIDMRNEDRLKTLVQGLAALKNPGPDAQKLRDLYADYVDQTEINAKGLTPLAGTLKKIADAKTLHDILVLMADPVLQTGGPVGYGIGVDARNPDAYDVEIYQSGLGLPREYYLQPGADMDSARASYRAYLTKLLSYAGDKNAAAKVAEIWKLEVAMAKLSLAPDQRRDANKNYNPMTLAKLQAYAPAFDWQTFLTTPAIPLKKNGADRKFVVVDKGSIPALTKLFAETPVSLWQAYLTVHLIDSYTSLLPEKYDQASFDFYNKTLSGQMVPKPRALRGVYFLNDTMGMALGKLYVAKYFPPQAKSEALKLVHNLLAAYRADVKTLGWMSPATREKALLKLSQFTPKIGYPDTWRDYSKLSVHRHDLIGNYNAIVRCDWERDYNRLDKPVDRSEWGMSPQTNNAYYNPSMNEVVFPAAILTPPFFDMAADPAVNYGEIGATIGHEISHGFDDQGSKYDGHGVLKDWWTRADRKAFDARTAALVEQFNSYEPLPGMHINGKLTLGENIADLAGLVIAYKAYHLALGGKPAPVRNGLTGDQRFFIAYAQSWRELHRDGVLRQQLVSDPHSPSKYRVNAVVRNVDAWYAAFNVKPGEKYYLAPEKRVRLW